MAVQRVLIAPDSFKGSLTSPEAARAIRKGLVEVWPDVECVLFPVADGGEGTVDTLVNLTSGRFFKAKVDDPLGRPVEATWGLLGDGRTAVVECASSSGLTLLAEEERNAAVSSSRGFGQLINLAVDHGVERLIVGLGGSATNDAGSGLLEAFGVRFFDDDGHPLRPGGLELSRLKKIDFTGLNPRLAELEIIVATDVVNPLTGPNGASHVFGRQKGADDLVLAKLDQALKNFASVAINATGREVDNRPGAGAAGGLGAAFMLATPAVFRPGIELVLEIGGFEEQVRRCDLIVTGEGRTDRQTAWGKVPAGVTAMGRKYGVPVVVLAGSLGAGYEDLYDLGVGAVVSIIPEPMTLSTAMAQAEPLLVAAASRLARTLSVFSFS